MTISDQQPTSRRCRRCGTATWDSGLYCSSCGAALPIADEVPPPSHSTTWVPWALGGMVALLVLAVIGGIAVLGGEDGGVALASDPPPSSSSAATSAPPVASAETSAEPSTAPPSIAPTPSAPESTPAPVAPPLTLPGTARVLADDLSVRTQPVLGAPLVSSTDGYGGSVMEEEVRLDAGSYVHVHRGPLIHDGLAWYAVMPLSWDGVYWDNGSSDGDINQGWVAGGYAGSAWLVTDDPPPTPAPTDGGHMHGGPPIEVFAGIGNDRISTDIGAPIIEWNAASTSSEPCTFVVDIVTPEGSENQRAVDETVGDAPESGRWFTSLNTEPYRTYEIVVTGTCSWTFSLSYAQG